MNTDCQTLITDQNSQSGEDCQRHSPQMLTIHKELNKIFHQVVGVNNNQFKHNRLYLEEVNE